MIHFNSAAKRGVRRAAAIGLAGALLATLAACSTGGGETGGGDQTLRIAVKGGTGDTLDPNITPATQGDLVRSGNLYDGLTAFGHEGELEYRLAESMEPNADATVWTVKLRPDVTFHDGSPLTAADVVATIERIQNPDNGAKGASTLAFIPEGAATAVDDLTVEIALSAPYGPFPEVWTSPYLYIVPASFDPAEPVGTGPFELSEFVPGQHSLFTANEDYWDGAPKVDALDVISFEDNQAQINALQGGQIDIASAVSFADVPALEETPGIEILENKSQQFLPIYMRTDLEPFDDPKVREALRLVVDRQEMIDVALNGYGTVANDMLGGLTEDGPDLPQREQDIDRAKQLLAEAGKSDLTVELTVNDGVPGMVESAQVFAEQAAEAGVTVNLNKIDEASYLDKYTEWPMGVDFFTTDHLGLVQLLMLPDATFNLAHWDDPEYVSLSQQMFAEPDAAKRAELLQQMRTIEHERGGLIIWGWVSVLNTYSDRVEGLVPDVSAKPFNRLNDVSLAG